MSQSSNSTSNTNIFSEISSAITDNKNNSATTKRVAKRSAFDEIGTETKKINSGFHLNERQASMSVPKSSDQPKFVSASMMASSARENHQIIPEISDEELLAMAIEFEKKYPQ